MRRSVGGSVIVGVAMLASAWPVLGARSARALAATATFSTGELAANVAGVAALTASGCGVNTAGEPSVHVSRGGQILVASERGVGSGSDTWVRSTLRHRPRAATPGGPGTTACDLYYDGQPNAVAGVGAAGGDVDSAIASRPLPGTAIYPMYVASLNLGSVSVSRSLDNGTTWQMTPVQAGLPGDDREWIAAFGASTSLLSYHDLASNQINVLRSDDAGATYAQVGTAIPLTGRYAYAADDNQHGNIAIDRVNPPRGSIGSPVGFRAYQSFVAPSAPPSISGNLGCADPAVFVCADPNEAFVSVSTNGGVTWTPKPIPCSISTSSLAHEFPNISVAPNGNLWETWSDGSAIRAALSTDQGDSWSCTTVATGGHNLMPWVVAGAAGEGLVYYGETGGTWYVNFAQNTSTSSVSGWTAAAVVPVHNGPVCELGFSCTGNRQLFDDFGVDLDPAGYAHIAYSHDCTPSGLTGVCSSPPSELGGPGTYTGYAVQTGGTTLGAPN